MAYELRNIKLIRYAIIVTHPFNTLPTLTLVLIHVQCALLKGLRLKTVLTISWIPDRLLMDQHCSLRTHELRTDQVGDIQNKAVHRNPSS